MSKFFEKQTKINDDQRMAVDHAVDNTSSITNLLLVLSEYLDHGGNDEVGAELMADFAIQFAAHEEENKRQEVPVQQVRYLN